MVMVVCGELGASNVLYRLAILLLSAPFVVFTRLAGFYMTPDAVWFTVYALLSLLCVITAVGLWWLGSAEEPGI